MKHETQKRCALEERQTNTTKTKTKASEERGEAMLDMKPEGFGQTMAAIGNMRAAPYGELRQHIPPEIALKIQSL